MKHFLSGLIFICSLLFCHESKSQQEVSTDSVFTVVEVMPEFPGGKMELLQYITKRYHLPLDCPTAEIPSKLNIRFIVDASGKIKNAELLEKVSCKTFEKELCQIFLDMPLWSPGNHKGKNVSVQMNYPLIIDVE